MIRRRIELELPWRFGALAPSPLAELSAAAGAVAAALVARAALEIVFPGVAPFALLFPAVLLATLLAGWRAGALGVLAGGLLTWYFVLPPQGAFGPAAPGDLLRLALFAISAGLIVALSAVYRRSAVRFAAATEQRIEEHEALLARLRESEARRELATSGSGIGVWDWRLDSDEMIYSDQAKAICGFPLDAPVTIEMVRALTHPDDAARTRAQSMRALDPALRDEGPYEYRIVTPGGDERWIFANGRGVFEQRDGGAVATRYVGTLQDITARKALEVSRAESEARLRLAVEAGRMAIWAADGRAGTITNSLELNRLLGFPDDAEPTLAEVNARWAPGERDRVKQLFQAAVDRGERFIEAEYRYDRSGSDQRWLLIRTEVQLEEGIPVRGFGVIMDITERKRAEDRLRLLAREVDHRANNLLAVVQGTVALSNAPDTEGLKAVIVGRVSALARAHQLLSDARWEGADLRRLVEEELLAFALGAEARVSVCGDDIALAPAAAQGLAMALHELATNAAKYGSLSTPDGRVDVSWNRGEDGRLRVRWVETGGPKVSQPGQRGLGTTILRRALEGPIGGSTRLDWRPEGLVCELEFPISEASAAILDFVAPLP